MAPPAGNPLQGPDHTTTVAPQPGPARSFSTSLRQIALLLATAARLLLPQTAAIAAPAATPAHPTFNRDIRPILAEHCLECHGQDEKTRKGGLRLDLREPAERGGKSGVPAIVPGKPDASALVQRIETADSEDLMPPHSTGRPLTPAQKRTLRQWIQEGARYEGHWAFTPVQRPEPPQPGSGRRPASRPTHPIDALVAETLRVHGQKPAPQAPPEVLIRRLALDLTGVPPTPADVDGFLRAHRRSPERAFSELVDRLLASPRFGEKWARHWLDAARYSDSDGYEKDLPRHQWTWRDWALKAVNEDMPYDRFLLEQIAGDLLPGATQASRVATGFLRNSMVNEEGAILAEQFRMEAMFDRMDCIGKAVLGITLQCAQCHSHKFDPLSQEEYYRLFAFLNDTYESQTWVYTPEQTAVIERIHRETARIEADLKARLPDWQDQVNRWEDSVRSRTIRWEPLVPVQHEWIGGLSHPNRLPDHSILTLGFRPTTGELLFQSAPVRLTNVTGLRLEALTHGDLPFGGPGRSAGGTFAISELELEARPAGNTNIAWKRLGLVDATADYAETERPISKAFSRGPDDKRVLGPATFLIDGKEETAWGPDRGPGRRRIDQNWVARLAPTNTLPSDPVDLRIWLKYRHGGSDGHGRESQFLGRFRLSITHDPAPRAEGVGTEARRAMETPRDRRTPAHHAALFAAWRTAAKEAPPEVLAATKAIDELWKAHPEGDSVLSVTQREPVDHRTTHILDRGAWDKPGKAVTAGVPAFLHPLPAGSTPDRLAFARWLADRNSPTTARVFVNRVWQSLFGLGLVETPDDLGTRAPLPTHPALLDWLAVEFMEPSHAPGGGTPGQPWSLKHLLRVLVHSATYRQDSRPSPGLLEQDPQNKWLARGPRFRAESEVVRDIALAASGLLHEQLGGPSFYPPVPENMFGLNFVKLDWKVAPAPERYRRSLYVFRRRSMPDPVMASFDAPNADFACVRRVRSNTPLAALTSLNEQVFVEAAQALALRTLREVRTSDEARAAHAFRLCTGRQPTRTEVRELLLLLESRQRHIAAGWIPAREVAFGDPTRPVDLPEGVTPSTAAAWTIVARVLLNLDETITKQ